MRIGVYDRWLATLGGGERYMLALARALRAFGAVEILTHHRVPEEDIGAQFGHVWNDVTLRSVPDTLGNKYLSEASAEFDFFVNASHRDLFPARARRSVLIAYFPLNGVEIIGGSRMERALARGWELVNAAVPRAREERRVRQLGRVLSTYQSIWAISDFVRLWVSHRWSRDSALLYPPVDHEGFSSPVEKANIVLAVGRFFAGRHNKKHAAMIRTFKKMCDEGLAGWQFHLVGGCGPQREYLQYLNLIKEEAAGYPVFVHPNLAARALCDLYGRSKLFWHAAGFDEDEASAPERCEHFGISTVEAMAAGCVPLVAGMGGQPEIVNHCVDGYLWHSLDELAERTRELIVQGTLREEMAARARLSSRRFDIAAFEASVAKLMAEQLVAFR